MISLDGSLHEGGGAMLRHALGFSMLLKKPFTITNVRANRPKPGLSWQHLTALNAAHQACDAEVEGNSVGATTVMFTPHELKNTRLSLDIGTAGSITLLLQSFLLPVLFSTKEFHITVKGGTDVQWSIPVDYWNRVLLTHLRKYAELSSKVLRRGFYPKGDGLVTFSGKGNYLLGQGAPPILLSEQKTLFKVSGVSFASADLQASEVVERQVSAARLILGKLKVQVDILTSYTASASTGSGVTLWGVCGSEDEGLHPLHPVVFGSSALGDKALRPEIVGEEAAKSLLAILDSRAAVDEHLADQLIPILAFTGGTMRVQSITDHVKSAIYVAEKFLPVKFVVEENVISCETSLF